MLAKDCIDEEKIMSICRQVLIGITLSIFFCMLLFKIVFFDIGPCNHVATETLEQKHTELQIEQMKELKVTRIAIEKLTK